eukprot:1542254-Pleurochrysis_carterae.AAC.1
MRQGAAQVWVAALWQTRSQTAAMTTVAKTMLGSIDNTAHQERSGFGVGAKVSGLIEPPAW